MSNSTTIPRLNLKTLAPLDDPRVDLAKEAHSKLGYNKLARAIAIPAALLFNLRKLEIEPLAPQQVRDYKRSKEYQGWYSGTKRTVLATVLAGLFTSAFITGMVGSSTNDLWAPWHYGLNVFLAICMGSSAIVALVGWLGSWPGQGHRKVRKWNCIALDRYEGNVPEFVLSKAVQIANVLPETRFTVEYLVEEHQHYTKPKPDPFLIATLETESYYIDVWDEKEYETRF